MKMLNASIIAALALALTVSATACTPRTTEPPSSSSMISSSMSEPSSSSKPSSSEGIISDAESTVESAVESEKSMIESAAANMSTDLVEIGALGGAQVKWGPGVQVDAQNRSTAGIQLQQTYGKYSAYFIAPADCGKLYLTFDEGYENGFSPAILDVLKEKGVHAVFFITGDFAKSQPELVQRMIAEGHTLGNHTSKHLNPTQISLDRAASDIMDLHSYVFENFNYTMTLYRPPEGAFSEQTLAMAQSLGYSTVLWSFAYADWDPNRQIGYDAALARTTKFIHEGAVYLLHAVSRDNSEILGALIDEMRSRGLTVADWDLPFIPPFTPEDEGNTDIVTGDDIGDRAVMPATP